MKDKLLAADLTRLIDEYENRQTSEELTEEFEITKDGRVGDLWYNPETTTLYVCFGRINGKLLWKEVNAPELK